MSVGSDGLYAEPFLVLEPGRHTAAIKRLDADREGRFLVTASDDKTVRVWAAEDGRLLRTLRLPAGPGNVGKAYAAAISPDGALVAAGGWTRRPAPTSVYLFERASGRLLRRVGGLPNVVNHLAFSPDGTRLAATLGGGEGVRLIDPAAGRVVAADEGYGGESYGAAFDAAGRLATTSCDGKVRLYDPGLRLLRAAEAPGGKRPYGIAFSPDGRRLAVGYDDTTAVDVLDAGTLGRLFAADTEGVDNGKLSSVAWSADGGSLYAAGRWQVGGEFRLRRWPEGGRGAPVDLPLSRSTVMALRGLPGGRLAFAAADPRLGLLGADGAAGLGRGAGHRRLPRPARTSSRSRRTGRGSASGTSTCGKSPALFSLPERRLAPGGSAAGLAAARTAAPGLAVEGWKDGTEPSLNGGRLALEPYETARSLAVAPDGRRFVLGSEWSLRLFDQAGTELWRRPVPGVAWAVNVSGDGRLVVAAYGDGTIRWHRLSDGAGAAGPLPAPGPAALGAVDAAGYYDASPGAEDLIGWQVNRGRDEAPEFYTASRFRDRFHRPDVIDRVLQELDVDAAVAKAGTPARAAAAPATVLDILPPTVAIIEPQEGAPAPAGVLTVTYTVERARARPAGAGAAVRRR